MGIREMLGLRPRLETKSEMPLTLRGTGVQELASAPSVETEALIANYRTNALVRGCVVLKGNSVTEPRLIVQDRTSDGGWEEIVGHPMRRLLRRPNPGMTEAQFIAYAQRSIDVTGLFYAEIVRSGAQQPAELWPLQPNKVKANTETQRDGSIELVNYTWTDGSYSKDIPIEDMLVRDDAELGGTLSPLAAAIREIDMDGAQTDYIRSFFNNAGVPSGILKMKERRLKQDEADEIRGKWRSTYGRQYGNQHDVAVLDETADYERTGAMLDELDSNTTRGFGESRITMGFGVPPLIVYAYFGLVRATYNNLPEAWKQFWISTMASELRNWNSFFELNLLPMYEDYDRVLDEKIRLYWDKSEVAALNESQDEIQDRSRKNWIAGGITLDEFRTAIGYVPYKDEELGGMNYIQLRAHLQISSFGGEFGGGTSNEEEPPEEDDPEKIVDRLSKNMLLRARQKVLSTKTTEEEQAAQDEVDAYGAAVGALVSQARDGEISRDEFESQLKALAEDSLHAMFLMGMLFADDDELTDSEWESLDEYIEASRESAEAFGEDIYNGRYGGSHGDGEEGADPDSRIALWAGTAAAVWILGKAHRRDNPYFMFELGFTEEHCTDCANQDGMIMTAKEWRSGPYLLPRSGELECGGWYCDCRLNEVIVEE